jgi:hypothetical protein
MGLWVELPEGAEELIARYREWLQTHRMPGDLPDGQLLAGAMRLAMEPIVAIDSGETIRFAFVHPSAPLGCAAFRISRFEVLDDEGRAPGVEDMAPGGTYWLNLRLSPSAPADPGS